MIRATTALAMLLLAGCAGESPGDVMVRTLENAARAACDAYDGCTNRCADGRELHRMGRRCVSD